MTVNPMKIRMRPARSSAHERPSHLFAVGQAVRLKSRVESPDMLADIFHVTRTLPPLGTSPQYRIRNDDERHERVSSQNDLEAVPTTLTATTLVERTFGHG